jgi:hypothetical protein
MPSALGPLAGVRILDAASLLAGPTAATLLSEYGAEIIKVEQPSGDTMRRYPPFRGDTSLLWKVVGRNRRSITLDLRVSEGREVLKQLAKSCDVVVLNYRPETLAKWSLDFEDFVAVRSDIIVLQLTAFGRTGPYANRPGFARVAEAFAGLTFRTGFPDGVPSQAGYPMLGDGVAGLYGAFAVMLALRQRERTGEPQLVDLGLYEPMLRIIEDQVAAYDEDGTIMERIMTATGSASRTARRSRAPSRPGPVLTTCLNWSTSAPRPASPAGRSIPRRRSSGTRKLRRGARSSRYLTRRPDGRFGWRRPRDGSQASRPRCARPGRGSASTPTRCCPSCWATPQSRSASFVATVPSDNWRLRGNGAV